VEREGNGVSLGKVSPLRSTTEWYTGRAWNRSRFTTLEKESSVLVFGLDAVVPGCPEEKRSGPFFLPKEDISTKGDLEKLDSIYPTGRRRPFSRGDLL